MKNNILQKRWYGLHLGHWLILLLSSILTFITWLYAQGQLEDNLNLKFERETERVITQITERMDKYEGALEGGAAMLHAHNKNIDAAAWARFAKSLHLDERYPGINGIGVVYNFKTKEDLKAHIKEQQKTRPYFQVKPDHTQSEYWPITFIEPENTNIKAVGLDLAFETNRRRAIIKARDTGDAHITGPIVLVQDAKKTPGFLLFVPRYSTDDVPNTQEARRASFQDIVYAPFIMSELMQGTLGASERDVLVQIQDVGAAEVSSINTKPEHHILYDETNSPAHTKGDFYLKTTRTMYGRLWEFKIYSNERFHKLTTFEKPLFILVIGLLIEGLLLTLFLRMARANRKIANQGRVYRQSMLHMFQTAVHGMLTLNENGTILAINPACEKIFGCSEQKAIGENICMFMPTYFAKEQTRMLGISYSLEGKRKNGQTFPLELSVSESKYDKDKIYTLILHDITLRTENQSALLQSNRYLNLAEDLSGLGHWRLNIESQELFWSDGVYKIHERDLKAAVPTLEEALHYYHPDDVKNVEKIITGAMKSGGEYIFQQRIITEKGKIRHIQAAGQAEKNTEGKVVAIFGIIQDVTLIKEKEKELENTAEFYRTILDTVPDKVFVKDGELRIIEANKAFWSMYDTPAAELLNTTALEKFPKEQAEGFIARDKKVLQQNEINETEEEITTKNGDTILHYTRKIPFNSELKGRVLLGIAQDITAWRQAEEEQKILIQKLSESNGELEEFAFVASHDLQEPLRIITNFSDIIRADYIDKLPEEAGEYLKFIHDGASHMQDLVRDMLEYARLSHNESASERLFEIKPKIDFVQENLRERIDEIQPEMIVAENMPTHVMGNPARFVRVLQNLVSNSLKYQPKGQVPKIQIACQKTNGAYKFSVKDNGIGMKEEHWDKVFMPFQRLHSKSEYRGTGIGLAICQKIVNNWGGEIWFDSKYGKGTTFYFTLPSQD